MNTARLKIVFSGSQELACALNALFEPDDLVELRLIESWTERGKRSSRLIERRWQSPAEVVASYPELKALNLSGANVYFGVNPRTHAASSKSAVVTCRSVWADFDNVTVEEAMLRCRGLLPPPSVLIASGHGVHTYWLLQTPFRADSPTNRERFERMLKRLYTDLGSDSVQDICRILRLPSFDNMKGTREGAIPTPCRLLHCNPSRRYSLAAFARWMREAEMNEASPPTKSPPFAKTDRISSRIRRAVQRLHENTSDRSRRDFAVVCELLRLGCGVEEIRQLVQDQSKFKTHGLKYLQTTLNNAVKATANG